MDDDAAALQRLIEERGEDYAGLSRLIGRNPAYIQQFIKRGTPAAAGRGGPAAARPLFRRRRGAARRAGAERRRGRGLIAVPRLDVGAAAGAGAFDGDERGAGAYRLRSGLAAAARARRARTSFRSSASSGDSMAPTLADGDDILVDRGDGAERLRDGIYVLRIDDALVVKRLALNPAARTLSVRSDNPAYPGWPDCDPAAVDIVGRVVWAGRRIG